MKKKPSRKIINEAIQATINGDPLTEWPNPIAGIKSVGSGIKGAGQNMVGNYRTNRAKSYIDQFAQKTEKNFGKYSGKAKKIANKMAQSNNPAVSQTGKQIDQEIEDARNQIGSAVKGMQQAFPSSVGGGNQKGRQPSPKDQSSEFHKWFSKEYDFDWDSLGASSKAKVIDQFKSVQDRKRAKQDEYEQQINQKSFNDDEPSRPQQQEPQTEPRASQRGSEKDFKNTVNQSAKKHASTAEEEPVVTPTPGSTGKNPYSQKVGQAQPKQKGFAGGHKVPSPNPKDVAKGYARHKKVSKKTWEEPEYWKKDQKRKAAQQPKETSSPMLPPPTDASHQAGNVKIPSQSRPMQNIQPDEETMRKRFGMKTANQTASTVPPPGRRRNIQQEDGFEGMMSMADFMSQSEGDPEEERRAKEKHDIDLFLLPKKKKR